MAPKVRWDYSRELTRVEIPTACGKGKILVEVSSDGCAKIGGTGRKGSASGSGDRDKSTTKYSWAYANSAYCSSGSSSCDGECECDCESSFHYECECESDCGEGWGVYDEDDDDSEKENELSKRFSVHSGVNCYYCNRGEIRGVRWVYAHNPQYSACSVCVPDGYNWRAVAFPWEDKVPCAPLSDNLDHWSDRVVHLQQVLTQMGYMSLEDTDMGTGYFQTRTANAVEKFRRDYRIMSCNMRVYGGRTQKKMEEVVAYYGS